jgi:hypothetical protein
MRWRIFAAYNNLIRVILRSVSMTSPDAIEPRPAIGGQIRHAVGGGGETDEDRGAAVGETEEDMEVGGVDHVVAVACKGKVGSSRGPLLRADSSNGGQKKVTVNERLALTDIGACIAGMLPRIESR